MSETCICAYSLTDDSRFITGPLYIVYEINSELESVLSSSIESDCLAKVFG
jgi:hypothetical protein